MKDKNIIWWDRIDDMNSSYNKSIYTERAKVYGGWLVRCTCKGFTEGGVSVTFVPDPDHKWELDSL